MGTTIMLLGIGLQLAVLIFYISRVIDLLEKLVNDKEGE